MARGGHRPGAGRKPGSGNRKPVAPVAQAGVVDPARAEQAEQVALLVAAGMEVPEIAAVMDLTQVELRARFRRELKHGALIARATQIARLAAASAGGNASAAKQLLAIIGTAAGEDDPAEPGDDRMTAALRLINGGRP